MIKMYLKNLIENKFTLVSSAALVLIPYYTWKTLYYSYKSLRNEYEDEILFQKRHNCVVMYTENKGMSGWPPHTGRVKLDINKKNSLDTLHEPILYFINTAKKSLDIAFMLLDVNSIYMALKRAHERGIKLRILLNYDHCESRLVEIKNLAKEGIEVLTYISHKPGLSSIMHYKFMVKDYTEYGGFVLTGSLNLSKSAFLNNYEDVVFISNQYVAKAFYQTFEECWNYIKVDNECLINKTVLLDTNLP
ncbi:hypothetical protein NQ314_021067 [Rhamnusium bicolor]|uniref:Mitochondrial cardiolipin hydrolase n=1 Tax=Rhamnusium bicolor TaxID=1586634 RepID=A0AAV8WJB7_9CUCU|nr:hypothetical protein NQ314_021067 [Rhamnusium bicolor]